MARLEMDRNKDSRMDCWMEISVSSRMDFLSTKKNEPLYSAHSKQRKTNHYIQTDRMKKGGPNKLEEISTD